MTGKQELHENVRRNCGREAAAGAPTQTTEHALSVQLLTVKEVAELLRLSPGTVYEWVVRDRIPSIRLGRAVRFLRSEIVRWLEARKEG